jgi:hypothetical protein
MTTITKGTRITSTIITIITTTLISMSIQEANTRAAEQLVSNIYENYTITPNFHKRAASPLFCHPPTNKKVRPTKNIPAREASFFCFLTNCLVT